jgi:Rod binding domain-containing protein
MANAPNPAREVAEEFEAVFLNTILETMFSGVKTDGMFGGGHSESMYRSMMNQEYASAIAKSGGIGIADDLYEEILRVQEASTEETE